MNIVQSPAEILRTPAVAVNFSGPKLQKIIIDMTETLRAQKDPPGVGLAANQVGLTYRLFLARFSTKKDEPVHVFINPEILDHSAELQPSPDDKKPQLEGCLSRPNYYGLVQRWQWVRLKYLNKNLKLKIENFRGFPAVVVQHEMDHLSGKIFIERILEQGGKLYKLTGKDKKGKDIWQEVEI